MCHLASSRVLKRLRTSIAIPLSSSQILSACQHRYLKTPFKLHKHHCCYNIQISFKIHQNTPLFPTSFRRSAIFVVEHWACSEKSAVIIQWFCRYIMYNDTNCTALLLRNLKSFPDLLWAKPDALSVKPIPIIKCLKNVDFFHFPIWKQFGSKGKRFCYLCFSRKAICLHNFLKQVKNEEK